MLWVPNCCPVVLSTTLVSAKQFVSHTQLGMLARTGHTGAKHTALGYMDWEPFLATNTTIHIVSEASIIAQVQQKQTAHRQTSLHQLEPILSVVKLTCSM